MEFPSLSKEDLASLSGVFGEQCNKKWPCLIDFPVATVGVEGRRVVFVARLCCLNVVW